jgi:hypothetical protein
MLSQKRLGIAQNIGTVVAYDLFVMMLNPKNRGENFTLDVLVDMVKRKAILQVSLAGDFGRDVKAMEEIAEQYAQLTIKHCIKESGVRDR